MKGEWARMRAALGRAVPRSLSEKKVKSRKCLATYTFLNRQRRSDLPAAIQIFPRPPPTKKKENTSDMSEFVADYEFGSFRSPITEMNPLVTPPLFLSTHFTLTVAAVVVATATGSGSTSNVASQSSATTIASLLHISTLSSEH